MNYSGRVNVTDDTLSEADSRGEKGSVQDVPAVTRALYQLDEVLSSTNDPTLNLDAMTTHQKDETSWAENTSLLRNLRFAPSPDCNTTRMTVSSSSKHPRQYQGTTLLEDTILGEDCTLTEEPTVKVGEDLIMAFHRELTNHTKSFHFLDIISAFEKCCDIQLNLLTSFEKQTRCPVDQLQAELCLEKATWQLMQVLAHDRLREEDSIEPPLIGDTMASDKELAEQLFVHDSRVRQAQLVVDWLEGLARAGLAEYHSKTAFFADNVCWENTLHDVTHGVDHDLLITEMDPDAPTRQQRKLSGLDIRDELSLNNHLFTCIRAGQLDKALELCVDSGQPLKALMLEGWKLHHDPNINTSITDELEQVEGNECRDIWKTSCWQLCQETNCDVFEVAVFATLSGNVQKMLPACKSWYDYVWAYFKTAVDIQVEKILRNRTQREALQLPLHYWNSLLLPQQIFQEIESSSHTEIKLQSQSHFHVVQKYIIMDDIAGLLKEMVGWLSSKTSLHHLRFMAHVALMAHRLGGMTQDNYVNSILEEYVKALIDGHYQSTVALYVSKLPAESQISAYAHLLSGVKDEAEQRYCLNLGRQAGLDMGMVTRTVVERIRTTSDKSDDLPTSDQNISELDMEKIRAINWLTFEELQRHEAIKQGNALMRQFLTVHKFSSAKAVLEKIPEDSIQVVTNLWQKQSGSLPPEITADLAQLQALRVYLNSIEEFNCWFQHFHYHKPISPQETGDDTLHERTGFEVKLADYKVKYEQWKSQVTSLAEEASTSLHEVLIFPGGWMNPVNEDEDDSLTQQLEALRHTCIPEVCFLLHSLLHTSSLYNKCLLLGEVIASEDYKLYKNFTPTQLQQLLTLLKKSALNLICEQYH